ncbi:MAG: hypothetical protein MZV70_56350 [Desulfobacterales bacterium]|nr:hypothetical protein [Desulfobacterales bacterium]
MRLYDHGQVEFYSASRDHMSFEASSDRPRRRPICRALFKRSTLRDEAGRGRRLPGLPDRPDRAQGHPGGAAPRGAALPQHVPQRGAGHVPEPSSRESSSGSTRPTPGSWATTPPDEMLQPQGRRGASFISTRPSGSACSRPSSARGFWPTLR